MIATGSEPGDPADRRAARARGRVDEPRGHRPEGGPGPPARARRRPGRCRDGAGDRPHGRLGRADRRRRTACCPASRSRSAMRCARRSRPTASRSTAAQYATQARRHGDGYELEFAGRQACCAATSCWSRPGASRASRASASRRSAIEPEQGAVKVDDRMSAGDKVWAIGDVTEHLAADLRRQVPGPDRGREHPRARRQGELRRSPARRLHRSAGRVGGRGGGPVSVTVSMDSVPRMSTYYRDYDGTRASSPWSPTASASPVPTRSAPRRASGSARRRSRSARACRSTSSRTRSSRSRPSRRST